MDIFGIIAKLMLDKSGFDAGLDAAGKRIAQFGQSLKHHLAGAFGAAALIHEAHAALEYAENIGRAAAELEISTDAAQQLGLAARLAGGDVGTFSGKFERLRKAMAEAVIKGKAGPFEAFAIGLEQLKEGDPVAVFEKMAIAIDRLNERPGQMKSLGEIFGAKGLGEVIRVMQHLEKAKEEAVLISPKDIENAKHFGEQISIWKTQLMAAGITAPKTLRNILMMGRATAVVKKGELGDEAAEEAKAAANAEDERRKAREAQLTADIASINNKAAAQEEKNRQAKLDDQQKLDALLNEEFDLREKISNLEAAKQGEGLEAAQARLDALVVQGKIDKLEADILKHAPKEAKEKQRVFHQPPSDLLGRIGGTVGGGESLGNKVNEMVREMKQLRRTLEVRGIRINGEL